MRGPNQVLWTSKEIRILLLWNVPPIPSPILGMVFRSTGSVLLAIGSLLLVHAGGRGRGRSRPDGGIPCRGDPRSEPQGRSEPRHKGSLCHWGTTWGRSEPGTWGQVSFGNQEPELNCRAPSHMSLEARVLLSSWPPRAPAGSEPPKLQGHCLRMEC